MTPTKRFQSPLNPGNSTIPAGTTYVRGAFYNSTTKSIEWKGTVPAKQTRTITFTVKVNSGIPPGTKITNTAILGDDANGGTATPTVRGNEAAPVAMQPARPAGRGRHKDSEGRRVAPRRA